MDAFKGAFSQVIQQAVDVAFQGYDDPKLNLEVQNIAQAHQAAQWALQRCYEAKADARQFVRIIVTNPGTEVTAQ